LRAWQLAEHPICQHRECSALAAEVDHRRNLATFPEGYDRETARYDPGNLQSLCIPHHRDKTAREAARGRLARHLAGNAQPAPDEPPALF